jgi:hypothetical protein
MGQQQKTASFHAVIELIGINPYVFVPEPVLEALFREFGKNKGPIPVCGTINGKAYQQTLVRFDGEWRLYINTKMLPRSPKRIGEEIEVSIGIDHSDRTVHPHPKLLCALEENQQAKNVFVSLTPSLQNEMVRYIANLKTEESVDRNVTKAIGFLLGKERFIGRDEVK